MNLLAYEEPTRFHEQKLVNQMVRQQCEGKYQPINHLATFRQMNTQKKTVRSFLGPTKLPSSFFLSPSKLAVPQEIQGPMAAKSQRDLRCLLHCLGYVSSKNSKQRNIPREFMAL